MLSPVRTAAPATTPVSLVEAKAHLRVEDNDNDTLITALIQAATDHVDGWSGILGRALVTQTWRVDMAGWPHCRRLRMPLEPVQSVTAIAYWDAANADQVFAASGYSLHADGGGPFVIFGNGLSWPSVYRRQDAVRVTFVAGYGAAAAVPAPIKAAILLMVGDLYAHRETVAPGSSIPMSTTVNALLAPYSVPRL